MLAGPAVCAPPPPPAAACTAPSILVKTSCTDAAGSCRTSALAFCNNTVAANSRTPWSFETSNNGASPHASAAAFEGDDVIRGVRVSRSRGQQATASRGHRWIAPSAFAPSVTSRPDSRSVGKGSSDFNPGFQLALKRSNSRCVSVVGVTRYWMIEVSSCCTPGCTLVPPAADAAMAHQAQCFAGRNIFFFFQFSLSHFHLLARCSAAWESCWLMQGREQLTEIYRVINPIT